MERYWIIFVCNLWKPVGVVFDMDHLQALSTTSLSSFFVKGTDIWKLRISSPHSFLVMDCSTIANYLSKKRMILLVSISFIIISAIISQRVDTVLYVKRQRSEHHVIEVAL